MSFLDTIKSVFTSSEQTAVKVITAVKTGVAVAEADAQKALSWIAGNAPTIAAAVVEVEQMIAAIADVNPTVASNTDVTKAIAEANQAVDALNAFATAANTGKNDAQAVVSGYVAFQQAAASAATAKAAIAGVPTAAAA